MIRGTEPKVPKGGGNSQGSLQHGYRTSWKCLQPLPRVGDSKPISRNQKIPLDWIQNLYPFMLEKESQCSPRSHSQVVVEPGFTAMTHSWLKYSLFCFKNKPCPFFLSSFRLKKTDHTILIELLLSSDTMENTM